MSEERQETIEDIVDDIRANARGDRFDDFSFTSLADSIEAAAKREVAELRECLKDAIREKCPFTRMSCKHGEPCDYECGTFKWRKALQNEGDAE